MTLRLKLALQIALTLIALVTVGGAALWGINGQHADFGSAIAGYEELRQLYEVGSHVQTARKLLSLENPDPHAVMREVQLAADTLQLTRPHAGAAQAMIQKRTALQQELADAQAQLWEIIAASPPKDPSAIAPPLEHVLRLIADMSSHIGQDIRSSQDAAASRRKTTMVSMTLVAAVATGAVILLGLIQYRGVTRPLRLLGTGVRRLAGGHLGERIVPAGSAEFVALGEDFNRMAQELDELYQELEQKVAVKSRELVRSERLASVGFLAAGVAHEINNPIGIIAGYAEFQLEALRKSPDGSALAEAQKTLALIAEEAFRCKAIVRRLLELARPGEDHRTRISLGDVAASVISTITGLKDYKDRRISLEVEQQPGLAVLANEGEMKQVILNLVINALEATQPPRGQVTLRVRRDGDTVELSVEDNGKGMGPEILEHVFEPFFTAKRGAGSPGTGLGLSITNAIVESHGGQITAHSDGPARGSRFTVRLPAT